MVRFVQGFGVAFPLCTTSCDLCDSFVRGRARTEVYSAEGVREGASETVRDVLSAVVTGGVGPPAWW